ncbi:MAG TPA: MBL fold metallo-hydrolase [Thermopetrobacter sp.]|nr:MBL fold metallo-hydrolase [Thermopetrobacter sp.]
MIHEVLPVGMLACNCSIYGDEQTREAIVVDPGDNVDTILAVLKRHGLKVTAIVVTHGHIDHVAGAQALRRATGAPVYMNAADQEQLDQLDWQASWLGMPPPERVEVDSELKDGDRLTVGPVELTVLHTPGHTRGSCCLWIPAEQKLIAGDTLFRDSIGRTDLPGGDSRRILASIKEKLLGLPDETRVFPGHGEETTIGREKELNYFLRGL